MQMTNSDVGSDRQRVVSVTRLMRRGRVRHNRAYWPWLFDVKFHEGRQAALAREPRQAPNCAQYSYEAGCWFEGYDSVV